MIALVCGVMLASTWFTSMFHVIGSLSTTTGVAPARDRKSTRLNSSHLGISYAVFCLKKKKPATSSVALDQAPLHLAPAQSSRPSAYTSGSPSCSLSRTLLTCAPCLVTFLTHTASLTE